VNEFIKGEAPPRKARSDNEYAPLVNESIANPGEWISVELMEKHIDGRSKSNMYSKLFRQVGRHFSEVVVSDNRVFMRTKESK